jgi:hypothetical protein
MIKIGITERGDAGSDFSWMRTYKDYDGIILITKYLSYQFIEQSKGLNCIVHATITGHGSTIYEPYVPSINLSKILFDKLVDTIGSDRVVLRIDPIIPDDKGIARAINVYQQFHTNYPKKTRVRISFMDNYAHVKQRFKDAGLQPLDYYFHAPIELRKKVASYFPDAEICGEPGFNCIGCVSKKDLEILHIDAEPKIGGWQREECACLTYKVEMLSTKSQCRNRCLYCYWK